MTITDISMQSKLHQFINDYGDDSYCLELLQFFGEHPRTRFSSLALIHGLSVNGGRAYLQRSLRRLVECGVIETFFENNIHLYSLTENEALRRSVLDLAQLDWRQWQVLKQSLPCQDGIMECHIAQCHV